MSLAVICKVFNSVIDCQEIILLVYMVAAVGLSGIFSDMY